eukprot:CAMPEP_0184699482 /NCGR_PEP_ID=MMETSP0313-20130426/5749_1 /TAXON_ID=2792 /ORGANISM="Porphyridium aerugineum, Strain SAG 1380-2" /LENGTH=58 /DNA_ID=CAMNT_0027158585 /DNA_START=81 /DNA_END=254 /DNA_ORIENTATION=-
MAISCIFRVGGPDESFRMSLLPIIGDTIFQMTSPQFNSMVLSFMRIDDVKLDKRSMCA